MFGSGTACVVCPIEALIYKGNKLQIPTMQNGAPLMSRFAKELNDIQYGRTANLEWAPIVE
jgi:branched-chain amino acid aminotransferase